MNYIKGLYGRFQFTIIKKKFGRTFKTPFDLYAEVTEVDNGNIWIIDNDDIPYLVSKKNIKSFEAEVKPEV